MPSAIKTNANRAKKLVLRAGHVMRWSRGHDAITWFSSRGRAVFEERGVCGGRVSCASRSRRFGAGVVRFLLSLSTVRFVVCKEERALAGARIYVRVKA